MYLIFCCALVCRGFYRRPSLIAHNPCKSTVQVKCTPTCWFDDHFAAKDDWLQLQGWTSLEVWKDELPYVTPTWKSFSCLYMVICTGDGYFPGKPEVDGSFLHMFWKRTLAYKWHSSPARVVQWLDHLGAMCSRVWRALCAVGSRPE